MGGGEGREGGGREGDDMGGKERVQEKRRGA